MKCISRFLPLFIIAFLTACQSVPVKQETTVWDDPLWQTQYQRLQNIKAFDVKGRIGITHPQDSFSSNFLWQQKAPNSFDFRMYGAFGNTYALMKVSPTLSTLETGDDQYFEGADAGYLLYSILGWSVPVNYLQDWIKGLPTGIAQNNLLLNADGTLQQLNYVDGQNSYRVTFERYAEFTSQNESAPIKLPTKIKIVQGDNKIILSQRRWEF